MRTWRPRRIGGIRGSAAALAVGVVAAVAVGIAVVTWVAVLVATGIDQDQDLRQAEANAANLAMVFAEQAYRQIQSVDQTLRLLQQDLERDPAYLDLAAAWRRAAIVSDIVSQVRVADAHGHVVASTQRDTTETNLAARSFFSVHSGEDRGRTIITGPYQTKGAWFLSLSRRFNVAHGAFGGVVVASYDLASLMSDMSRAELGPGGIIMLAGRDGLVRATAVRNVQLIGSDISALPLFRAAFNQGSATWTGPSGPGGSSGLDRVVRIHAWRAVPGLDMAVIVGLDRAAVLAHSTVRREQALFAASALTVLMVIIALGVAATIGAATEREERLAQDRAVLEAANLRLARARAHADEKSLQLEMTLAGMSDGISMFSPELTLVQWNDRFPRLLGLPPEMLRVGLPVEELLRARLTMNGPASPPAQVEAEIERQLEMLRAPVSHGMAEIMRPDGVALELRRTRLPNGGWVTLYTDVTARKQGEAAQLWAREQLELAAQEKSRFIAIASHEIRTPLNVALNALELLDDSPLPTAERHLVQTGLLAGQSLMSLLNDILDLSRMQVGRMQLRPAPFALRPLLQGVVDMLHAPAAARGVTLSVEMGPDVPDRLLTDAGRLRQMVMNLVSNAAKFADPGPATIRVGVVRQGATRVLRLAVRDAGPDIPAPDRDRLFRPFSQLERPGTTGSGLGLAICQLLANLLGGEIGCDPVHTGGKEFWLTLPPETFDIVMDATPLVTPTLPIRLPRTRVLLVEDVLANQVIVATQLRREGHLVDTAASGLAALELLSIRPYDIVFIDIFMPGIDGLETSRRIRMLSGPASSIPLVTLTANVSVADRAGYVAAGIDGVVAKPVERAGLLAALARHVWRGAAPSPPQESVPAREPGWRDGLAPEVCAALLTDCVRQLRAMVPGLETAMRLRDAPTIRRDTHTMAGVAGNYGLSALEALIRAIAVVPPETLDAPSEAAKLRSELDRIVAAELRFDAAEAA